MSSSALRALCVALCGTSTAAFSTRLSRRAVLTTAAATAVASPAFAEPIKDAALFEDDAHNAVGDAALYMPSVRVESAGASSSMLAVVVPATGPRSVDDYVDCMWFKDANNFRVLAAEGFGPNGRSREYSLREDTGKEPSFSTRVKSGTVVIPMIHVRRWSRPSDLWVSY